MNRTQCLDVLRSLRDGCDPRTDDPLPAADVCQRPDVIRALFTAVELLGADGSRDEGTPDAPADGARAKPARPRPPNAGQPWTDEEDRRLAETFDGGADEREIAAAFGRSRSSIRARLIRLGRGALLGDGPAPRYPVAATSEPVPP